MRNLWAVAAAGLVLAGGVGVGAEGVPAFPEKSQGKVDVVMKDKGFRVSSGQSRERVHASGRHPSRHQPPK